ncbi:cell wall hydrolase [Acidimangrovimonas pyrenivorans]|uniref:Cell wall hydrolase n=1 Tax=Acidimangrovimonas pyrenivorans TaxID=2030798 RepID=A0ABV7AKF6_9RHOB
MRMVMAWARSAVLLVALSTAAVADVSVSQSNDPTASVDTRLSLLLGQERTAFTAISPDRLEQLLAPPPRQTRKAGEIADPDHIKYSESWLASLPKAKGGEQWSCLAEALYFEARGESVKGEFAVGEVILNRVDSARFPDNVCAVVNQGTGRRNACQFSFTCDGRPEVVHEPAAYEQAGKIARLLLDGAPRKVTDGATYFHTRSVHPRWSRRFTRTAIIGAHVFYRRPEPKPTQVAAN